MSSAEPIHEFIEQNKALTEEEAFLGEHPYPFLVQEKTKSSVPMTDRDRATLRLDKNVASAPAGDGFAQGDVWIHRVFPRDPENSQGAVTIGRDDECDVIVDDGSVSGVHAKFTLEFDEDDDKVFYLTDSSSANGTFLNGEQIESEKRTEVSDMDSIRFGPVVKFQFFSAPAFFQFMSVYSRIKKPQ